MTLVFYCALFVCITSFWPESEHMSTLVMCKLRYYRGYKKCVHIFQTNFFFFLKTLQYSGIGLIVLLCVTVTECAKFWRQGSRATNVRDSIRRNISWRRMPERERNAPQHSLAGLLITSMCWCSCWWPKLAPRPVYVQMDWPPLGGWAFFLLHKSGKSLSPSLWVSPAWQWKFSN